MDLIIYTAANDKTQAAVTSATDTTPVSNLEMLVIGDQAPLNITFTNGTAAPSWAGDSSYTMTVGLGNLDAGGNAGYTSTSSFTPITDGWSGTLPLNTQALVDALALAVGSAVDWTRFPTQARIPFPRPAYGYFWLQIKVIGPSGLPLTYANLRVCLLNRVLPPTTINTVPADIFYALQNRLSVTGLASASANITKLGGIPTAFGLMPVGAVVACNFAVSVVDDDSTTHAGTMTLLYQFQLSTAATAWPLNGRPYDYSLANNPTNWKLIGAWLDYLPAAYNVVTAKFHRLGAYGSAAAVAAYVDQVGTAAPA